MGILGIYASAMKKEFPGNIAAIWLDAADTTTISLSGSAVTQWNDKGSLGYNVSQSTATNRPASGTTTLNSKNVIAYDGNDVLTSSAGSNWKFLSDGTKYVMGYVIKVATVSDPENDIQTFGNVRRAEGEVGRNLQAESRGAGTGKLRAYSYTSIGYVYVQDSSTGVWTQDSPVVYTELNDATNATAADRIKSYFGTGSAIATNVNSSTPSTASPVYPIGIGATDQGNQGITGYIAELIIATGANATETNRVLIRDYLKTKWAL
jgi:hypothetical protein